MEKQTRKDKIIKKYNERWAQVENLPVDPFVINCIHCYRRGLINVNSFKIFSRSGNGSITKNCYFVCNRCRRVFRLKVRK